MRDGRRIWQWEFWPFWAFYAPVYAQLIGAGIRNRAFGHFCCANPGIAYGGLLDYSKHGVMESIRTDFVPATAVMPGGATLDSFTDSIRELGITYPLIVKPDRGERGFFVEKIDDEAELADYLDRFALFMRELDRRGLDPAKEVLLVQEYVSDREEFGVMWIRHPEWESGRITSIVHKKLLALTGDGQTSLGDLISSDERAAYHESMLRDLYASRLAEIPAEGELVPLVEIGNHSRGATFLNATPLADQRLLDTMTPIANSIPGFSLGRFDIRASSFEALCAGQFRIIEVNGVNSEPAHIYDPDNRLRDAYGDLLSHWRLVEQVAAGHRRNGCSPPSFKDLRAALGRHGSRQAAARASIRLAEVRV